MPGVYIVQNTMLKGGRGGGMVDGEKIKGAREKSNKKGREKGENCIKNGVKCIFMVKNYKKKIARCSYVRWRKKGYQKVEEWGRGS